LEGRKGGGERGKKVTHPFAWFQFDFSGLAPAGGRKKKEKKENGTGCFHFTIRGKRGKRKGTTLTPRIKPRMG